MKPEYEAFLVELCEEKRQYYHISQQDDLTREHLVYAECQTFTKKFVEKFPHLRRQAGFYGSPLTARFDPDSPGTEHWWCVDTDGTIVDPTAAQFQPGGVYTPFDEEKHLVQVGRCMNCGEYIFGLLKNGTGKVICSQECHESYTEYCMNGD